MVRSAPLLPSACRPSVNEELGLLVAADGLRTALAGGDPEAVHASLCLVRNALVGSNCAIGAPPGSGPRAFRASARHLRGAIDELLLAVPVSGEQCGCVSQAGPVVDQLIALAQLCGEVSSSRGPRPTLRSRPA